MSLFGPTTRARAPAVLLALCALAVALLGTRSSWVSLAEAALLGGILATWRYPLQEALRAAPIGPRARTLAAAAPIGGLDLAISALAEGLPPGVWLARSALLSVALLSAIEVLIRTRCAPITACYGLGAFLALGEVLTGADPLLFPARALASGLCLWIPARALRAEQGIGRKAERLAAMRALGLPVPDWIVVPGDRPVDLRALREQIDERGFRRLAVRSSAADEDGDGHAHAGMYASRIGVTDGDLEEAVAAVRASGCSERLSAYRRARGLPDRPSPVSVIVQRFVDAEVSGVAFGMNPVSGDRGERLIEACFGLGEGVVDSRSEVDRCSVRGEEIVYTTADKPTRRTAAPGGICSAPVPEERRRARALSEGMVRQIVDLLDRLERTLGTPQDIEFAVEGGQLWLLQSRDITAVPASGDLTIWDSSNIGDNYPGLTMPLTISFAQRAYGIGNRKLSLALGIPKATIEANAHRYDRMVEALCGRMYYNLTHIRALISLLPLSDVLTAAYDRAIGAQTEPRVHYLRLSSLLRDLPQLLRSGAALAWQAAALPQMRERFAAELTHKLDTVDALDYTEMREAQIAETYRDLSAWIVEDWRAPGVNGFLCMLVFAALERLIGKSAPGLLGDLLVGDKTVSAEIVDDILAMAEIIDDDEPLKDLFDTTSDDLLHKRLTSPPRPPIGERIAAHLQRYGDRRTGGELSFETPTLRERPELLIKLIRSHLGRSQAARQPSRAGPQRRAEAQALLSSALAGRPLRRWLVSWLLSRARSLVQWREDFRFLRTRAFGAARRAFSALGARLAEKGLLEHAGDFLWLYESELLALAGGTLAADPLRVEIEARRERYALFQHMSLPVRVASAGPAERYLPPAAAAPTRDLQHFRGSGCCPGRVLAAARVVRAPDQLGDLRGAILVAARADVGWVPYFPSAAGIALEHGSLLGHVAITARELGIPCVIGATGLVSSVFDGDILELDGATGEVTLIRRAGDREATYALDARRAPQRSRREIRSPMAYDSAHWENLWAKTLREQPDKVASRKPNTHLTARASQLQPGRALDAGCGHGAESLWLAAHGWEVTAVDFSASALAHARGAAAALGEEVAARTVWIESDLAAFTPQRDHFDLVVCLYVHVAGSVEEMVQRLASGVAVGGSLLLVGHRPVDPATGAPTSAAGQQQVSIEAARAALDPAVWEITAEEQPRAVAGSGVDAVIFARRAR